MSALQDFVINEGLQGWNVRYYLTAIQRKGQNDHILQVAYEVGLYNPLAEHIADVFTEFAAPLPGTPENL